MFPNRGKIRGYYRVIMGWKQGWLIRGQIRGYCGVTMGLLWGYCGVTMGLLWGGSRGG